MSRYDQEGAERKLAYDILTAILSIVLLVGLFLIGPCTPGHTEEVNIAVIGAIESSNNPRAFNPRSQAVGVYQITQIVVDDYNANHDDGYHTHYELKEMYNEIYALIVAKWYLNERIPFYLRFYHLTDNMKNRLWTYNAGIGRVRAGIMPKETREYIKKYERLTKLKSN